MENYSLLKRLIGDTGLITSHCRTGPCQMNFEILPNRPSGDRAIYIDLWSRNDLEARMVLWNNHTKTDDDLLNWACGIVVTELTIIGLNAYFDKYKFTREE